MDALPAARREKLASQLERFARHLPVALLPTAVIGLVDLATGFLLDDRLLDIGLLAAAVAGLWQAVRFRRFARGLRSDELPRRSAPVRWGRNVTGIVALLAVNAGIGYLVAGTVGGIALSLGTMLLVGASAVLGLRMRRRLRMSDDVREHS
jgi:hypothetical protein